MLSTIGEEGLWSSPFYFVTDDKNHLYFISEQHSRHIKNIWINNQASILINISQNKNLQLIGVASIIEDITAKNSNEYHKLLLFHKGSDELRKDAAYLVKFLPQVTYLVRSSGERIQLSKSFESI